MAKKNKVKIPGGAASLKNLIQQSTKVEEAFKQDKKDALKNKAGQGIPGSSSGISQETTTKTETQTSKATGKEDQTVVLDTEVENDQSEKFNIRERRKDKEVKQSFFEYEDFFQKYYPDEGEKRETAYLYHGNMEILQTVAKIEDTYFTDLLNNIVSAFIYDNQENIKKSLKKPSKLLG